MALHTAPLPMGRQEDPVRQHIGKHPEHKRSKSVFFFLINPVLDLTSLFIAYIYCFHLPSTHLPPIHPLPLTFEDCDRPPQICQPISDENFPFGYFSWAQKPPSRIFHSAA